MGIGMGIGKSRAVPKAFWLALVVVGMTTAYDDIRRQRPVRENATFGAIKIRAAGLSAPPPLSPNEPDRRTPAPRR